jgi:hypothetical protein
LSTSHVRRLDGGGGGVLWRDDAPGNNHNHNHNHKRKRTGGVLRRIEIEPESGEIGAEGEGVEIGVGHANDAQ